MNVSSQENQNSYAKIEEFESLRGVAALLIVLYHIPHWHSFSDVGIIDNGYLMVDLFFVLSGFVICNAYSNKITVGKDLLKFQFLRFGRLYPVHILFLFSFLLIEFAKYLAQTRLGVSSANSTPFSHNNAWAFVQNLLLINAVLPGDNNTFNYPAWSISVEFYTYLVFGMIVLYAHRNKELIFALIVLISSILILCDLSFEFDKLLRCFIGFFIGCLTLKVARGIKFKIPPYCSIFALVLLISFLQYKTTKEYDMAIYLLTSVMILSLLLSRRGIMNRILSCNILVWLGTLSYSVYMSHATIIWYANQVLRFFLKRPEVIVSDGTSTPQLSGMEALIVYPILILCVLCVSYITYLYLEKPMRQYSRSIVFSDSN